MSSRLNDSKQSLNFGLETSQPASELTKVPPGSSDFPLAGGRAGPQTSELNEERESQLVTQLRPVALRTVVSTPWQANKQTSKHALDKSSAAHDEQMSNCRGSRSPNGRESRPLGLQLVAQLSSVKQVVNWTGSSALRAALEWMHLHGTKIPNKKVNSSRQVATRKLPSAYLARKLELFQSGDFA